MSLSDEQRREVENIADLRVQRAMVELLDASMPRIIQAAFSAHNVDVRAHDKKFEQYPLMCPTGREFRRWKWLLIGLSIGAALSAGSGAVVMRLAPLIAGG